MHNDSDDHLDDNSLVTKVSVWKNICHLSYYCDLSISSCNHCIVVIDSEWHQIIINIYCFAIVSRSGRSYYVNGSLQGQCLLVIMEVVSGICKVILHENSSYLLG